MFNILLKAILNLKKYKFSFEDAFTILGTPTLTLEQENKEYNFMLDTGATHSIIDKNIIPKLKGVRFIHESGFYGWDGKTVHTKIYEIKFYYKEKEYKHEFMAANLDEMFQRFEEEKGNIKIHGILGCNFFLQYKYVIDFAKLVAYSKK